MNLVPVGPLYTLQQLDCFLHTVREKHLDGNLSLAVSVSLPLTRYSKDRQAYHHSTPFSSGYNSAGDWTMRRGGNGRVSTGESVRKSSFLAQA